MEPGDAFAQAYDRMATHEPVSLELQGWSRESAMASARSATLDALKGTGKIDQRMIDRADPAKLLGILSGLDHEISRATPHGSTIDKVPRELRGRFMRTGRFNIDTDGAVLPRYVEAARPRATAEALDEVFKTVRVSESTWRRCTQVNLVHPDRQRYDVTAPAVGIVPVSQIPFAAPGEIKMAHDTTEAGVDIYTCVPDPALEARVDKAMGRFRDDGALIGLIPESTLDDNILAAWQANGSADAPDWVLVGTGAVSGAHPGASAPAPPVATASGLNMGPNRAVLMHGKSGQIIAVQDKRHGFTILPNLKGAYGLDSAPDVTLDEGMVQGKKLTIIESRLGRVAVLVCEDLDHLTQDGAMLRELGVSMVLAPIVAPPILSYRWQHQASNSLAMDVGCTVVTFNSLALGRDEELKDLTGTASKIPATTLLVATPEVNTYQTSFTKVSNPKRARQRATADALTSRQSGLKTP